MNFVKNKILTNYTILRDKSKVVNGKEWEELLGPMREVTDNDLKS